MSPRIDIPEHPLLKKLGGSTNVMTLRGYIGAGRDEGHIRIYAALDDLSESVEVRKDEVLHFESTPEAIQPFGSTTVWLKPDAQTTYNVSRVENVSKVKEIRAAGRLKISVAGSRMQSVCQSVCGVCQSVCSVCQSVCAAKLGGGAIRIQPKAK